MLSNPSNTSNGVLRHALFVLGVIAALLLTSITPAQAASFPAGYPKMGTVEEAKNGHRIEFSNFNQGSTGTLLFPVYTAAGTTPNQFAYCIEITVSAGFDSSLTVGGWNAFPGNNAFKTSLDVRQKVAWIVYNSYPNRSLTEVGTAAGLATPSALTEKEAIAATQAAIWSLTDGAQLKRALDVSAQSNDRVMALHNYLKGSANTGRIEVLEPQLDVSVTGTSGTVGTLVGPLSIRASEDFVEVESNSPYPVVYADGTAADLSRVPGNSDLFIQVPSNAELGSAQFSVELTGSRYTGLLVINKTGSTHKQTLMISASDEVKEKATGTVTWGAAPQISTVASDPTDGDKFLASHGDVTVTDQVTYTGLIPGKEYALSGELMIRGENGAEATGIVATTTFTPEQASGTVELSFQVPPNQLQGKVIVVFERLYLGNTLVAEHTDISDQNQTVYRPAIETDAFDLADQDQILPATGGTLRDSITFSGLIPGIEYIVSGEVMDKSTATSTGIVSSTTFTPETSSGIVNVDFAIPAEYAGKTLVVFERIQRAGAVLNPTEKLDPPVVIAAHEDLSDQRQTVTLEEPETPPTTPPVTPPTVTPEPPTGSPTPVVPQPTQVPVESGVLDSTVEGEVKVVPVKKPLSGVLGDTVEQPDSDLAATGFSGLFALLIGAFFIVVGSLFVFSRRHRNN